MTQSEFNAAFQNQAINHLSPPPHDPRYITHQILRRDQRRTRMLAALTLLFWLIGAAGMLLMVAGLNRFILLMRIGSFPWNKQDLLHGFGSLDEQIAWGTDLIHHSIPFIQCSIVSLMLAALTTVLLIFSSRQATLNRINISLMEMSEQLKRPRDPAIVPEGSVPPTTMWLESRQPQLVLAACLLTILVCGITVGTVLYHTVYHADLFALPISRAWQGYPTLSPFQAVRWHDETPWVQVNGTWYELQGINGLDVTQIIAFDKSRDPTMWQKHFEEDLVELMTKMGYPPGDSVDLLLALPGQSAKHFRNIPMTSDNRWALWRARQNIGATLPTSQ